MDCGMVIYQKQKFFFMSYIHNDNFIIWHRQQITEEIFVTQHVDISVINRKNCYFGRKLLI